MVSKRIFLIVPLMGLISWGCTPKMTPAELEEKFGPNPPVIVKYGAAEKVTAGQPWRFFLAAMDPDGDMARIRFEIKQAGKGIYQAHWKKLDPDMAEAFSGYFHLNTPALSPAIGLDFIFIDLELRCKIYDKAEHASDEITVPFELVANQTGQPVPAGFDETEAQPLGPILIRLSSEANVMTPGFER